MRLSLALAALAAALLLSSQSRGADVAVTMSDDDQKGWFIANTALDQCISGVLLRGDPAQCRGLAAFLTNQQQKVGAAVQASEAAAKKAPEAPEGK